MKKLVFGLLLILLAPCTSFAENKFPIGVPVETQALFCVDKESAQIIADNKGDVPDELIIGRKCLMMRGVAMYVKEVYRKDGWAVWELKSGNVPTFYEATNWTGFKPPPKGSIAI